MKCINCKGEFDLPKNIMLEACPLCKNRVSRVSKMMAILEKYTTEIYQYR